jgi:hypothetical protein
MTPLGKSFNLQRAFNLQKRFKKHSQKFAGNFAKQLILHELQETAKNLTRLRIFNIQNHY